MNKNSSGILKQQKKLSGYRRGNLSSTQKENYPENLIPLSPKHADKRRLNPVQILQVHHDREKTKNDQNDRL